MTYTQFEEVIASSKIPKAMEELERLVKTEFKLEDHELRVDTSHNDRLVLIGQCAMGKATDRYARLLPKLHDYCRGFMDVLDIIQII